MFTASLQWKYYVSLRCNYGCNKSESTILISAVVLPLLAMFRVGVLLRLYR